MTTVSKDPGERVLTLGKKGATMPLEVPLTPEHVHALEKRIADLSGRAFQLEEEKKAAVQPINEALKDVRAQEKELLAQRAKGVMTADVSVETRANIFKREKWVERLDTCEEVPDTRRALTDEDLQILMPGVVKEGDNRPDAPVLSLFAPRPEAPAPAPWKANLPAPYEGWSVTESVGDEGERTYMIARGDSQAWGPFAYDSAAGALYLPGGNPEEPLTTEVRASMVAAAGIEADGDVPAHETKEGESHMMALERLLDGRAEELAHAAASPAPEGGVTLHESSGHPGWAAYVHGGQLWIRPPNVDRFEGPASPKDKGPLEWNTTERCLDGVPGSNVTSEWLEQNDRLLEEFDDMAVRNVFSEKVTEFTPASASAKPGNLSPGEVAASAAATEEPDAAQLAAKLTENGRRLLKSLCEGGGDTASRLGSKTGCSKPGSALNHLQKAGLVSEPGENDEIWTVTDLGRQVHAARLAAEK